MTFDIETTAGMAVAIEWRVKFRDEIRLATEAARKERKAPILEIGRLLDGRAKEITAEALPYEAKFDEAIKAHEAKRAAEKREREERERARVQAIQTKLAKLAALPEVYTSALPPADIARVIEQIEGGLTFDYQEFADQAEAGRQAALVALRRAHIEAVEREEREAAEEAARAAKAAQEAAEAAEREAKAKAEREADEKRLREEREKLEAEQARARRDAELQQRLHALRGPTHLTATDSPELIEQALRTVTEAPVYGGDYGEYWEVALLAKKEGMERLSALLEAAQAHKAEQQRMADARAELERQQREQAERQAEIERKEREQAQAEEARKSRVKAELDHKAAEAAQERKQEERIRQIRERANGLTAEEIAQIVAHDVGVTASWIAARIAEIPPADWVALALSEDQNEGVAA